MDEIEERLAGVEQTVQQHLSQDSPRTFLAQTPSAREHGTGLLFDFNQVFRGRRTHLSALDSFLAAPEALIAVLPGRGGIGKTKLLREWSGRKTAQAEARSKTKAPAKKELPKPETGAQEIPRPAQPVKAEPPRTASLFDAPASAPSRTTIDMEEDDEVLDVVEEDDQINEDSELDDAA